MAKKVRGKSQDCSDEKRGKWSMGENTITRIHSPDVAEVNMSESGEKQIKRNAVLYFDSK